jgi:hypothetical protein
LRDVSRDVKISRRYRLAPQVDGGVKPFPAYDYFFVTYSDTKSACLPFVWRVSKHEESKDIERPTDLFTKSSKMMDSQKVPIVVTSAKARDQIFLNFLDSHSPVS